MEILIESGPVIINDNKVLLVKDKEGEGRDPFWKFPGGKVELAEKTPLPPALLETTCMQEVLQECGVMIEVLRPLKTILMDRPNHPGEVVVLVHFLAKALNPPGRTSEDAEFCWYSCQKILSHTETIDLAPNVRKVLLAYAAEGR